MVLKWTGIRAFVFLTFSASVTTLHAALAEIDPEVAKRVCSTSRSLLCEEHIHIDEDVLEARGDELSQGAFHEIVKTLDPYKIYFSQEDVAKFEQTNVHLELDDSLDSGELDKVKSIVDLFVERANAHLESIKSDPEMQKWDVNQEVEKPRSMSSKDYTSTETERVERGRQVIRHRVVEAVAAGVELEKALDTVLKRLQKQVSTIRAYDTYDYSALLINSFLAQLDPHTSYMDPDSSAEFLDSMQGTIAGIGVSLRLQNGSVTVEKILEGGPAAKSGKIVPGDVLEAAAEAESSSFTTFDNLDLQEVVRTIKGPVGTVVKIKVFRPSDQSKFEVEFVRDTIVVADEHPQAAILKVDPNGPDSKENSVGWIRVPSFNDKLTVQVKALMKKELGINPKTGLSDKFSALVVDLRSNGGGLLTEAVDLTGLFIESGPVVQVGVSGQGDLEVKSDTDGKAYWRGPLVVAVDRMSASASEIFAGAIQDYKRGVIVGEEQTFGKGTVQQVMPLPVDMLQRFTGRGIENGILKATTMMFYRAGGPSTQHLGVKSDIIVGSPLTPGKISEAGLTSTLQESEAPRLEMDNQVFVVTPEMLSLLSESVKSKMTSMISADQAAKEYFAALESQDGLSLFEDGNVDSNSGEKYSIETFKNEFEKQKVQDKALKIDLDGLRERVDSPVVYRDFATEVIIFGASQMGLLGE